MRRHRGAYNSCSATFQTVTLEMQADGRAEMKNLLGGKGANLAESGQCHANPGLWLSSRMGLWGGLGLQSSSFDVPLRKWPPSGCPCHPGSR